MCRILATLISFMYDFIVIGGGISGFSAAMYASRLGLKTLVLAEMPGGLITTTNIVENWPGIKSISGPDLAMSLMDHATSVGAEMKNERAVNVENLGEVDGIPSFKVKTTSGEYQGKTVLIATGTMHRKLGAKGEKEFENKGVSYCALCDGAFYKGKQVAVVGGGDTAAKEAILLSEYAEKVFVIVRRDILRAEPVNADKIAKSKKIEVLYKTEINEIIGTDKVSKLRLKSGQELPIDGVFMAIGHIPQTEIADGLGVALNEKSEVIINRRSETNIKGVFAAGDCTDTGFKQAITGSAEGVTAAYYAYHICNTKAYF